MLPARETTARYWGLEASQLGPPSGHEPVLALLVLRTGGVPVGLTVLLEPAPHWQCGGGPGCKTLLCSETQKV